MKKIIVLSGIIIATLVSCSTDGNQTHEQNRKKTILNKENSSDNSLIHRDSIGKENNSLMSEPIKPKKD